MKRALSLRTVCQTKCFVLPRPPESVAYVALSPVLVALPFKLMLFVLADGWNLLIGSLAASFVV